MRKLKSGIYRIKPDKNGKPTIYSNKKDSLFIQIIKAVFKAIALIVVALIVIVACSILYLSLSHV